MSWWNPTTWDPRRIALGIGTFGMSEGGGIVPGAEGNLEAAKWGYKQLRDRGGQVVDSLDRSNNEFRAVDPTGAVNREADASSRFANAGERGFGTTGRSMDRLGNMLTRLSRGEDSLSAEQLRQNLGQTLAAQQSLAAGARPMNQAMAARTAATQMSRQQSGLAGQQALAGIAERQAAQQALAQLLGQRRQQDLIAATQGRQTALQGQGMIEDARTSRYGSMLGVPTGTERLLGLGLGAAQTGALLASDKRLKTEIVKGDKDADEFVAALKAFRYRYKDRQHGEGEQLGVMAQDLESTRFGRQIVRDTPGGKMVDTTKLTGANTAAIARLGERLAALESK